MNITLEGGPGDGKEFKVRDCEKEFFYFGEPAPQLVVNEHGYRSMLPVTPSFMYLIETRVVDGATKHIGVCQ